MALRFGPGRGKQTEFAEQKDQLAEQYGGRAGLKRWSVGRLWGV
jgi:hypothetical protein